MCRILLAAALAAGLMAAPGTFGAATAQQTSVTAKPAEAAKTKRPMSAGQKAFLERQKKCAAEWKEAKAAGKVEKGATWPKFLSACNKRLKAGG